MTIIIEPEGEGIFLTQWKMFEKQFSFVLHVIVYTSTKSACIDTAGNPRKQLSL